MLIITIVWPKPVPLFFSFRVATACFTDLSTSVFDQCISRWFRLQSLAFILSNVLSITACWCSHAGQYCEFTPCASRPCRNGGTCIDLVAGYNCTCPPAYVGRHCATLYCLANNPCRNGGSCHGAGLCHCPHGYKGCINLMVYESYLVMFDI